MRKFTLLFSLFVAIATTAMADFTQTYVKTNSGAFWCGAVATYPDGVTNVKPSTASAVYAPTFLVKVTTAGDVTVSFEHKTGDHGLNVLGVDILNSAGTVAASSYAYKIAGGGDNAGQKVYTLSNVSAGTYTLRYFVCNITNGDNVASAGGDVVITNAEMPLNTTNYYYINNTRGYVGLYSDGATTMKSSTQANALTWKFVPREDGLYDIKNASNQYISSTTTTVSSQSALTLTTTPPDNGWRFAFSNTADKYVIYSGTTQMHMLNPANANSANGSLVNWGYNSNSPTVGAILDDDGCNFSLEQLLSDEDKAQAKVFFDEYSGKVGYPTDAVIQEYKDFVDAAGSLADIDAAKAAVYASTDVNMPVNGKVYTITSVNRTAQKAYIFYNGTKILASKSAINDYSNKFVCRKLASGKYIFVPVIANCYVVGRNVDSNTGTETGIVTTYNEESCSMEVTKITDANVTVDNGTLTDADLFGMFKIKAKEYYWYVNPNNDNDGYATFHRDSDTRLYFNTNGVSNAFFIEEATYANTPALNAVGTSLLLTSDLHNTTMATFSAPFATVVPEGVTAYYATAGDGFVTLNEITSEAIPANTGVILVGANESITEAVMAPAAGETEVTVTGNVLVGTAGAEQYLAVDAGYILGIFNSEAGFYRNKEGILAMNKAYIALSGANPSIEVRFPGTTEIDEVKTENGNVKTVYDLQGRIVENPTAGIYIVNGKKVLVK